MKRLFLLLLLAGSLSVWAADNAANSPLAAVKNHWKTSKEYTLAVAQQMPDDAYNFRPNPEEMTFGGQIKHIAEANYFFIGGATGVKPSVNLPKGDQNKATTLKILADSYDYGMKQLDSMTDAQLSKMVDLGEDGKMKGLDALMMALDHATHHRAQAIVYLRVKGIKPTGYRF